MAKKKVVAEAKKALAKKKDNKENVREALIENLIEHVNTALGQIVTLNERIDRIVAALSTAKPIRKSM